MEQEFIDKINTESMRIKELDTIKTDLVDMIEEKKNLISKEQDTKIERNKSNYLKIENELRDLMQSIYKEYEKKIEGLTELQWMNTKIIDEQLEEVKHTFQEKMDIKEKEKMDDKNEKLNIQ